MHDVIDSEGIWRTALNRSVWNIVWRSATNMYEIFAMPLSHVHRDYNAKVIVYHWDNTEISHAPFAFAWELQCASNRFCFNFKQRALTVFSRMLWENNGFWVEKKSIDKKWRLNGYNQKHISGGFQIPIKPQDVSRTLRSPQDVRRGPQDTPPDTTLACLEHTPF